MCLPGDLLLHFGGLGGWSFPSLGAFGEDGEAAFSVASLEREIDAAASVRRAARQGLGMAADGGGAGAAEGGEAEAAGFTGAFSPPAPGHGGGAAAGALGMMLGSPFGGGAFADLSMEASMDQSTELGGGGDLEEERRADGEESYDLDGLSRSADMSADMSTE